MEQQREMTASASTPASTPAPHLRVCDTADGRRRAPIDGRASHERPAVRHGLRFTDSEGEEAAERDIVGARPRAFSARARAVVAGDADLASRSEGNACALPAAAPRPRCTPSAPALAPSSTSSLTISKRTVRRGTTPAACGLAPCCNCCGPAALAAVLNDSRTASQRRFHRGRSQCGCQGVSGVTSVQRR